MTLLQGEFVPTKSYTFQTLRYALQGLGIQPGCTLGGDFLPAQRGGGANLSIDVAAGSAWVLGQGTARQGMYHIVNDATFNVAPFTAGDGSNPRIDQVILVANDSSISGVSDAAQLVIVTGVATAGATLANRNGAVADGTLTSTYKSWMRICDVLMPVSASSVTTANIKERRPKIGGKTNIAATESHALTSYALLTTPDQVNELVLPTDALIFVLAQMTWNDTVSANGRASIFLNSTQTKVAQASITSPSAPEAISAAVTTDHSLVSSPSLGLAAVNDAVYTGDVTTGQLQGFVTAAGVAVGGPAQIFAAAGTYDVSVQFKSNAAGTVAAKNRKLWVWIEDPFNGVIG